jgi:hypothetical protein
VYLFSPYTSMTDAKFGYQDQVSQIQTEGKLSSVHYAQITDQIP